MRSVLSKRAHALFVVALCLSLVSFAAGAAPRIMVFGDSLSAAHGIARDQGWVALLRKRLAARGCHANVVNASISGETTAGGRARLGAALKQHRPDIVVLELGGNDGLRVLPPDAMRANLAAMIKASRDAGARVLLLGMKIPTNYGRAYRKRFHAVFDTLAKRTRVAYVSFFLAPIAADRDKFQSDGIHPKAGAEPALLDYIWPQLSRLLSAVATTRGHASGCFMRSS